jgi:hypothetical protein
VRSRAGGALANSRSPWARIPYLHVPLWVPWLQLHFRFLLRPFASNYAHHRAVLISSSAARSSYARDDMAIYVTGSPAGGVRGTPVRISHVAGPRLCLCSQVSPRHASPHLPHPPTLPRGT